MQFSFCNIKLGQFIRFSITGTFGFLTELVIITAVKKFWPEALLYARFISFPPALLATFFINKMLVFKSTGSILSELTLYASGQLVAALLNLLCYMGLIAKWEFFNIWPELALAVGSAVGLIFNYLWSKFMVFTRSQYLGLIDQQSSDF